MQSMSRITEGRYKIRRLFLRAASPILRRLGRPSAFGDAPDVIFLWIPKTAGTSIYELFAKFGMGKYKSIDQARYLFPGLGMATFVHQSVQGLVSAGAIQESYVKSAFKFSFVRNPYDRAVSLFHYFQRYERIPKEMKFSGFLEILGQQWRENRAAPFPAEALQSPRVCYRGEFVSPEDHTLYPIGPYNVYGWSQCRPQVDWLDGMGGINQIHIGRMENIDDDFQLVLRGIFSAREEDLARALTIYGDSVPKKNATPHRPYVEHYTDPALRRLVEEVYQCDFEAFGY